MSGEGRCPIPWLARLCGKRSSRPDGGPFASKSLDDFLQPPDSISREDGENLLRFAKSMGPTNGKLPHVFITFASGQRDSDAEGFGPGSYYVAAVLKRFHDAGIKCFSELMLPNGTRRSEFIRLLQSGKCQVMLVIKTPALFQSMDCLRDIYAAQTSEIPMIPLRFEGNLPAEGHMWPQVQPSDLEAIMMLSAVQWSFCRVNDLPSPPYTVPCQQTVLWDLVDDVKARFRPKSRRILERMQSLSHIPMSHIPTITVFAPSKSTKSNSNKSDPEEGSPKTQKEVGTPLVLDFANDSDENNEELETPSSKGSAKPSPAKVHVGKTKGKNRKRGKMIEDLPSNNAPPFSRVSPREDETDDVISVPSDSFTPQPSSSTAQSPNTSDGKAQWKPRPIASAQRTKKHHLKAQPTAASLPGRLKAQATAASLPEVRVVKQKPTSTGPQLASPQTVGKAGSPPQVTPRKQALPAPAPVRSPRVELDAGQPGLAGNLKHAGSAGKAAAGDAASAKAKPKLRLKVAVNAAVAQGKLQTGGQKKKTIAA